MAKNTFPLPKGMKEEDLSRPDPRRARRYARLAAAVEFTYNEIKMFGLPHRYSDRGGGIQESSEVLREAATRLMGFAFECDEGVDFEKAGCEASDPKPKNGGRYDILQIDYDKPPAHEVAMAKRKYEIAMEELNNPKPKPDKAK